MEEEKDLTVIEQLVDDLCVATFGPEDVMKDEQKQREIVKKLYYLMYPSEALVFKPLHITPQLVMPTTYKAAMDVSYEMNSLGTYDFVRDSLANKLTDAVKDNMSITTYDNPIRMTTTFEGTIDILPRSNQP